MLAITDIGDVLKPGIYLLTWRGKVVFVAKARCLLTVLTAHRQALGQPSPFFPRIRFDGIRIIPCAADRADALLPGLIDHYSPRYNRPRPSPAPEPPPPPPSTPLHPRPRR